MAYNPFEPQQPEISENDRLMAALSYVFWPVAVFVLLSEPYKSRPFQRYHAVQALTFGLAVTVVVIAFICMDLVLAQISSLLSTLITCLLLPVWLVPFAFALWFAYRAYQGQMFDIPYVTRFAQQQRWL
jgi:uncharacterized membrane protein